MSYTFSLEKRHFLLILAGLVLAGLLVFLAGLLVGTTVRLPQASEQAASQEEPEEEAPAPQPDKTTGTKAEGLVEKPQAEAAPQTKPPTAPPAAAPPEKAPKPKEASPSEPSPLDKGATLKGDSPPAKVQAAENPDYSIQAGAFLDMDNALTLISDLKEKGYQPRIFAGADPKGRFWYCVRIGEYPDKESATLAAADFAQKEKIQASVRPSNAL